MSVITSNKKLISTLDNTPPGAATLSKDANLASINHAQMQKSLGDLFSEIDVKYTTGMFTDREAPTLDRLELKDISAEDILGDARVALEEYKVSSLAKIEADDATKKQKLTEQESGLLKSAGTAEADAIAKHDAKIEPIKANALSKGLARSSIVENQLTSNELAKQQAVYQVKEGLVNSLNAITQSIAVLDAQKQSALNAFDIAYAAKLEEKISKLTQDAEKANQDIIKYNNTITRQEESLRLEQEQAFLKQVAEYAKIRNSSVADYFADLARSEKLNAAYDYLNSMSKVEAIAYAKVNSDLRVALGHQYQTLMNWLNLRES